MSCTFQSVLGNVWFIGGLWTWGQIDLMPLWNINRVGCFQCGEGGVAWGEIAFAFDSMRFYNRIKLRLCIILCGHSQFDRFHPLWGPCNLWPVFRVHLCFCRLADAAALWKCVCLWALSHSLFHQYIWSSSHAVRWPLTPGALSWSSLASVSAGARWSPRTTRVKTRVVYFNLPLYTARWENAKAKRKLASFEKLELCNLP